MIKCIRCDDNTTVDYIALGTIDEPVCMDCITEEESTEKTIEDFIKIEGGY
jgi:hypothetical protein